MWEIVEIFYGIGLGILASALTIITILLIRRKQFSKLATAIKVSFVTYFLQLAIAVPEYII